MAAYDQCWIFGDSFCASSFEQYFKSRCSDDFNGYTKVHFDATGYYNNFTSDNPSVISCMGNLMTFAMESKCFNQQLALPKLVVVVPDDDLIKLLGCHTHGLQCPYNRILNYVMTEFECNISIFKENLPAKCLKSDYPHILWIQAPLHDGFQNNQQRVKFNSCLEDVVKVHSNSSTLMLKKAWEPKNLNLFLEEQQCFTSEGYRTYWEAVDKTIHYCDSIMLKKHDKGKNPKLDKSSDSDQKDRFKWQHPKYNRDFTVTKFKKLPPPPPPVNASR